MKSYTDILTTIKAYEKNWNYLNTDANWNLYLKEQDAMPENLCTYKIL